MEQTPTHCRFNHPGFATLGNGVFRLTTDDRVAALALRVDSADVVVPLPAVARLFGISPDSADGQMLRLVEQALRFVPQLQPGDKLPTEVLTGEASWAPSPLHQETANAKLQLQLLNWIGGLTEGGVGSATGQFLIAAMDDPSIKPRVQDALRQAATALGIDGGPGAVAVLIGQLAQELAYIEALRERLLERARAMLKRLSQTSHDLIAMAPARRETLFQVGRLAITAVAEVTSAFETVDAQTAEIGPALRNLERHRSFLRSNRDRLYSTMLAWQPLLAEWDTLPKTTSTEPDRIWRIIDETYRFLAPRFMSVQQWQNGAVPDRTDRNKSALVW